MAKRQRKDKRKRAKKKLSERVNLRVTEEEFALLEMASQQDERSLSNWARRALVVEARRQLGKTT
jgi:predicted HicB family RNase H-like nuclease